MLASKPIRLADIVDYSFLREVLKKTNNHDPKRPSPAKWMRLSSEVASV
jgi:hypothetical protein